MAIKQFIMVQDGKTGQPVYVEIKSKRFPTANQLTARRIKTDPLFARTRENNACFARAAKGSQLLRRAIRPLLLDACDSGVSGRLTAQLYKVLKEDPAEREHRTIQHGDLSLLRDFECNADAPLKTILLAPYTSSINRAKGKCTITIKDFLLAKMLLPPPTATHFKWVSLSAAVDFEEETYDSDVRESAMCVWSDKVAKRISLTNILTPQSTKPIFLVFGLQFYEEINGKHSPLSGKSANPLSIIVVDIPV